MTDKKKTILRILIPSVLVTILVAGWMFIFTEQTKPEPKFWIGFFDYRLNFRDVGLSLNECLHKPVYAKGIFYRSNKYFSGWGCEKIQNPYHIYSLNYRPNDKQKYYCLKPDGTRQLGLEMGQDFEIQRIEKLEDWKNPKIRKVFCAYFQASLQDILNHKTFLYHCDAGRDRTGAMSALMGMALSEQKQLPINETVEAIECDFEKTTSLGKKQYGRMRKLINDLENLGGVSRFLEKQCGVSKVDLQKAAAIFVP